MPVMIQWYSQEKAILLLIFVSPWAWEEADAAMQETARRTVEAGCRVDLIVDVTRFMPMPSNLPLVNIMRLLNKYPPPVNSGLAVYVGGTKLFMMLGTILLKIHGDFAARSKMVAAQSMDEALNLIESSRKADK